MIVHIFSGDFHSVLTSLLDGAFVRLLDLFAEYYKPTLTETGDIKGYGKVHSCSSISQCIQLFVFMPIANSGQSRGAEGLSDANYAIKERFDIKMTPRICRSLLKLSFGINFVSIH